MSRSWIYVFVGGLIEVIWVSGLKHADSVLAWIVTVLAVVASFYLIMKAANRLPVGTVYAVFTGLGTGGTVVGEMLLFGEPFQWSKTLLIALLLAGVVGLKLVTDRDAQEGSGA